MKMKGDSKALISLISVIFILLVGMVMAGYATAFAPLKPKVQEEKPTPSVSEPPHYQIRC